MTTSDTISKYAPSMSRKCSHGVSSMGLDGVTYAVILDTSLKIELNYSDIKVV